jgi:VWFA-related protein
MGAANSRVRSFTGLVRILSVTRKLDFTSDYLEGRPCPVLPRARVSPTARIRIAIGFTLLAALTCAGLCRAQQPPDAAPSSPAPTKQEVQTSEVKDSPNAQDATTSFKVRVNLVLVRVVVRDADGKIVPNLKKDDFELRDNRKPQTISTFSVETPASHASPPKLDSDSTAPPSGPTAIKAPATPQRFVALLFDDLHLSPDDSLLLRKAAAPLLSTIGPGDRFGIFTTSGTVHEEFSANRDKLNEALQHVASRSDEALSTAGCPPMTYYQAYQILEGNDPNALQIAVSVAVACSGGGQQEAIPLVKSTAQRELSIGENKLQVSFGNLDTLIRRMTTLPGQRIVVLMSPGFFVTPQMYLTQDFIDKATKAGLVINIVDARGVYTSAIYNGSTQMNGAAAMPMRPVFVSNEESVKSQFLEELADGTGGTRFENRNDLDGGLRLAAAEPELSYVLGFTPQDLKFDGKYHPLKVTVAGAGGQKWTVQARHGYFAPRKANSPEQTAEQEIDEAVYSQEVLRQLPLECQTQIFKTEKGSHLTVIARVDARSLKFSKVEDRNNDQLKIVMALFDNNGGFLSGKERNLNLQLKDVTLAAIYKTGIRVKFEFEVPPGTFTLRVVARDSEGAQLGATSHGVVVPN